MSKVLSLVSYKIFPAKLGGQKGIALFNRYFSQYHKLTVVTIKDNDPSLADYEVLNILSNSKWRYINIFYYFKLRRLTKEKKIDYLLIEHPYFGWLAILLKWFSGVPFVIHSHNIEGLRFKSTGRWWWGLLWNYESFVHRQAEMSFCISEDDRQYMIRHFGLKVERTLLITYGIEWDAPPTLQERKMARLQIQGKHQVPVECTLFLFNGTLDYSPNLEAVRAILNKIDPLFTEFSIPYKIFICGKNLPKELEDQALKNENIIYAGFVDDITTYFKGCDIFINPVTDGGGIKTKLVEALGYDMNAVSTQTGAIGVDAGICNGKLLLAPDTNWVEFVNKMKEGMLVQHTIPPEYYVHFYWKNIARKAAQFFTP